MNTHRLDPEPRRRSAAETGGTPASVIIVMGFLLMFIELIAVGGRVAKANADVVTAGREAARHASVAQYSSSVLTIAEQSADDNLEQAHLNCDSRELDILGTDFRAGGSVTVNLTCTINLGAMSFFGLPYGIHTFETTATEIVETFRAVE